MSRATVKLSAAFGSGATIAKGALSGYPPKPPARPMIAHSGPASGIVPANTVIVTRLALPAGPRYKHMRP